MGANMILSCFFILLLSITIDGSPYHGPHEIRNKEIVGQATNIITAKILKGAIESNKNTVFSPIGYATILAILGEGAHDDTNHDIITVLKHPEDRSAVRSAYHSILTHLQGSDPHNAPQFRSWFYIYKNNSVEESYKQLIANDYFVTVRDVEPYNPDEMTFMFSSTSASPSASASASSTEKSAEEQTSMVDIMDVQLKNAVKTITNNSKDIVELDTFKKETEPVDETRIDNQKDASKFDEVVEDRQYVEVPIIKEEIRQTEAAIAASTVEPNVVNDSVKAIESEVEQTTDTVEKKLVVGAEVTESEKLTLPLKQFEEMEIMQAEESRFGKAFGGKSDDGASILSGNSIVGEKENASESDIDKYEPKMLLFNGLYYRGNWATPFQHLRDANVDNLFYTDDEKVQIKMMKACGYFRYAKCEKLNSEAVEFPYENERYSMLVVYPNARDGLKSLINELSSTSLNEITAKLEEELMDVSLPKFEVETTSGAEKTLAKEGLASLFTSKADFSGISPNQKLRVGELQQHVTLRVDEGSSTENFLTATNTLRSNAKVERSVTIDRPFLFFVRDRIDDVILVAGKITSLDAFEMHEPEIPK